jgi:hypothetical protein
VELKTAILYQDYFAADNRFGFCNSGNGQVRIFMSNTHTPSNILFSRAFSDTSYNDLMKISYTGDLFNIRVRHFNRRGVGGVCGAGGI